MFTALSFCHALREFREFISRIDDEDVEICRGSGILELGLKSLLGFFRIFEERVGGRVVSMRMRT